MRRPYEIKNYLRKKEWYDRYKANVESSTLDTSGLLAGRRGLVTISKAFNWRLTAEGVDFWAKVNDEFIEWYLKPKRNGT